MKTQTDRVLAALRQVGADGLTQLDFDPPVVLDGGPPIRRVAARIEELRDAGHAIDSTGRRSRCAVYVLKTPASLGGTPAPAMPPPSPPAGDGGVAAPLPLPDQPAPPRLAIYDYDPEDEAA